MLAILNCIKTTYVSTVILCNISRIIIKRIVVVFYKTQTILKINVNICIAFPTSKVSSRARTASPRRAWWLCARDRSLAAAPSI